MDVDGRALDRSRRVVRCPVRGVQTGCQELASRASPEATAPRYREVVGVPAGRDVPSNKYLHLGVSASGARYDALWTYVTPGLPDCNIPRIEVTIDGQPLTVGQVSVSPQGTRSAIGRLDAEGRFTLSSYEIGDGAPIGTHAATVTAVEGIDERSNRWHAPKKYANKVSAGLWVTIDGPTDDLKIELTWEGSGHDGPYVDKF